VCRLLCAQQTAGGGSQLRRLGKRQKGEEKGCQAYQVSSGRLSKRPEIEWKEERSGSRRRAGCAVGELQPDLR